MGTHNMLGCLSDNIVVDSEKCIFCGLCVERCILDNLRMTLASCRQACPLALNCQGYVQLIARGEEEKAMAVVRERLPFPGILGRICSQPCEDGCGHRETDGEAVSIRALKRYLDDRFQDQEPPLPEMKRPSGRRVAIVGSGPAGMIAAYDIALQGHQVTVYDRESAPGGMLRWSIPVFRLPQDVLERELKLLERMGIGFKCGVTIGRDRTLDQLEAEYDAILLATGLAGSRRLNAEGEDGEGVFHGLPFLKAVRSGSPPVVGERVVVIGGGNVAVDVAQTAYRLGAASVQLVCLESRETMPAFNRAVFEAISENIELLCSWGNPRFTFEQRRLKGVRVEACASVFDSQGCFNPVFDSSTSRFIEADTVIIAIGQALDDTFLRSSGYAPDDLIRVNPLTCQASIGKFFAAGDLVSGPSSVVAAMAAGKEAAESINRLLRGVPLAYGRGFQGDVVTNFEVDRSVGSKDRRMQLPHYQFTGKGDFTELESGVSPDIARREARRCHSCGLPFGQFRTCWFCLPCEVECPTGALWVDIPYLLR